MVEINPISFDSQPIVQQNPLLDPRLQQLLAQQQAKTLSQALLAQATAQTPIYSTRAGLAKALQGGLAGYSEGLDQKRAAEQEKIKADSRAAMYAAGVPKGDMPDGFSRTPPADEDPAAPAAPAAPVENGPAPEDGTPGPQASVSPSARESFIGLTSRGVDPIVAAGATGNFGLESGFDPNAKGDPDKVTGQPTAFNIGQWRKERVQGLRDFAQARGTGINDFEVGLDHAADELTNPRSPYYGVAQKAAASGDPRLAARLLMQGYEIPSGKEQAKTGSRREALAAQIYASMGQQAKGMKVGWLGGDDGAQTADAGDTAPPALQTASDASPNAVTGGAPMPAQPAQGPAPGPNGGVMSAPTNQGSSMEMLPLQQGGGYAPAPPPRPQQLSAALQGRPQGGPVDETGGTPIAAAAGKLAYAGGGPIQSDAPPIGGGGLIPNPNGYDTSLLPPGVQPGTGAPGAPGQPEPTKEAQTRTLVGPSPVINDGRPVPLPRDPRLAPQGAPQGGPAPDQAPQGVALASKPSTPPAPPTPQQLTPRARAALGILSSSGFDAQDKAVAQKVWEQETRPGHVAYDKAGNMYWQVPGGKPELIHDAEKADVQIVTAPDGTSRLVNKDKNTSAMVPGFDQKSTDLSPPFIKNEKGQMVQNPDYAYRKPNGEVTFPNRASTSITNNVDLKGETKFSEQNATHQSKRFNDMIAGADKARAMKGDIDILAGFTGQIATGKLTEARMGIAQYAKAMGFDDIATGLTKGKDGKSTLGEMEAMQALVEKLAPNMRAVGSGATSDYEMRGFKNSLPSLLKTTEGNRIVVETFRSLYDYSMAQGEIAERVVNGELSQKEGGKLLREMGSPFDLYKQHMARAKEDAGGGSGGGGAGTGSGAPRKIERNGVVIEQMD